MKYIVEILDEDTDTWIYQSTWDTHLEAFRCSLEMPNDCVVSIRMADDFNKDMNT